MIAAAAATSIWTTSGRLSSRQRRKARSSVGVDGQHKPRTLGARHGRLAAESNDDANNDDHTTDQDSTLTHKLLSGVAAARRPERPW